MSVEQDARLFGQHFEVGWCLGLLVARNVHKRAHAGRPKKCEPVRNKVSCAQFAKLAGVSTRTVQLVYDTWSLAAEENHCTPADRLSPGDDDPNLLGVDIDDQEHREMWRKFYCKVRERPSGSGTRGSSGRQKPQNSPGGDKADESSSEESSSSRPRNDQSKSDSAPEDHPLYGLLLAMNELCDALKFDRPIVEVAEKVASRQHRAQLRRIIGVL